MRRRNTIKRTYGGFHKEEAILVVPIKRLAVFDLTNRKTPNGYRKSGFKKVAMEFSKLLATSGHRG